MAKVKCRPQRTGKKPGPKTVPVKRHVRSKPNSADLKIERATKHILELNVLFRERHPFSYVLETNTKTSERSMFAKQDKAVVSEAATICGDIVHNLSAGLDHAYWEIVSPYARIPREERNIQFPFSETAARLEEAVQNRLANRVSTRFFQTLIDLKPHGEFGGNELLYLIYKMNTGDKHRMLTPMAYYAELSSKIIQRQVADFPFVSS